jgi:hypothetical protein
MDISDELLEKYRHFNVEHTDWWDYTYDDFKSRMIDVGIRVDEIYFSGFCSQGAGACFKGEIENTPLFLEKHCKPDEYPMIRKLLASGGTCKIRSEHRGHYYHENCTTFDVIADQLWQVLSMPTEFHEQIVEEWDKMLKYELQDFEKESVEIFKRYMRELYRELEQDYDYLTSDEAVKESIIANDLTETETEGV